jgi:hypothetical protein
VHGRLPACTRSQSSCTLCCVADAGDQGQRYATTATSNATRMSLCAPNPSPSPCRPLAAAHMFVVYCCCCSLRSRLPRTPVPTSTHVLLLPGTPVPTSTHMHVLSLPKLLSATVAPQLASEHLHYNTIRAIMPLSAQLPLARPSVEWNPPLCYGAPFQ